MPIVEVPRLIPSSPNYYSSAVPGPLRCDCLSIFAAVAVAVDDVVAVAVDDVAAVDVVHTTSILHSLHSLHNPRHQTLLH